MVFHKCRGDVLTQIVTKGRFIMNDKKVLIGLSGGVDSSAAACLLQSQGYACEGATMRLWDKEGATDANDARAAANTLGIPFHYFDMREAFESQVIRSFISCYESGGTPNPCIVCNRTVKFGLLLEKALSLGFTHVATGHYARILRDEKTGRYLLYRAKDAKKDQTYFLACLDQHQLSHTLFPLGELVKEQARQLAEENNLITARKRDSQDICFVPDGDYVSFMKRHTGKHYPSGSFLDLNGEVVGQHCGAVCYTLGQRKGLGLAMGSPVYVCGKDMEKNTVTVGPNDALFSRELMAVDFNWIPFPHLSEPITVTAKTRHSQSEAEATVYPEKDGQVHVVFDNPQRAVTPGQAVVLYQGDLVIGSGTIAYTI